VVAQFSDPGTDGTAADYSATIAWGDGSSGPGVVSLVAGSTFQVTASHAYAEQGSYPVGVTVTDSGGAAPLVVSAATVSVADAPLSAAGAAQSYGTCEEKATGPVVVAQFSDPGTDGTAADYSATVAWGDGSTSPGAIALVGGNTFAVTASHAYAEQGSYAVGVTVTDRGGALLAVNSATVSVVPGYATGTNNAGASSNAPGVSGTASDQPSNPNNPHDTITPPLPSPQPREPAPRLQVSQPHESSPVVAPAGPRETGSSGFTVLPFSNAPTAYSAGIVQGATQGVVAPSTVVVGTVRAMPGPGMTPLPLREGDGAATAASTATNQPGPDQPAVGGREAETTGARPTPPPVITRPAQPSPSADLTPHVTSPEVPLSNPAAPTPTPVTPFRSDLLGQHLDALADDLAGHSRPAQQTGLVLFTAALASAGYVVLKTRLGSWLLSVLAARPLWKQLDPLEVLFIWEQEKQRRQTRDDPEDVETLQSMVG
jgi:hypothetical protein